jgi:hypothetical protein
MPENIPNLPGGAVPPKPAEAAKVQPKKETVRINLPPKPTSAPTIKLPTLSSGGPPTSGGTAAPVAASAAPKAAGAPSSAPPAAAAPAPAAPPPSRASSAARQPAAPAPAPRAPVYTSGGVGKLDKGLAIFALVVALAAVGSSLFLVLGGVTGLTPN